MTVKVFSGRRDKTETERQRPRGRMDCIHEHCAWERGPHLCLCAGMQRGVPIYHEHRADQKGLCACEGVLMDYILGAPLTDILECEN